MQLRYSVLSSRTGLYMKYGWDFDGRELCENHRIVLETEDGQRDGHVGEGRGAFAVDEQRDLVRFDRNPGNCGLKIFDQGCVHII